MKIDTLIHLARGLVNRNISSRNRKQFYEVLVMVLKEHGEWSDEDEEAALGIDANLDDVIAGKSKIAPIERYPLDRGIYEWK